MLRVGWLWQVDLDEFTARLHQIALTKPAWVPKIRAVVVDTLAKRVGADGAEPEPDADAAADEQHAVDADAADGETVVVDGVQNAGAVVVKAAVDVSAALDDVALDAIAEAARLAQEQCKANAVVDDNADAATADTVKTGKHDSAANAAPDAADAEAVDAVEADGASAYVAPPETRPQTAAQLAAQQFTDEEAQQIFVLFDADASGTVDIDELVVFVKAIKGRDDINPAAVSEVWDKDNSGEVTCPDSRLR